MQFARGWVFGGLSVLALLANLTPAASQSNGGGIASFEPRFELLSILPPPDERAANLTHAPGDSAAVHSVHAAHSYPSSRARLSGVQTVSATFNIPVVAIGEALASGPGGLDPLKLPFRLSTPAGPVNGSGFWVTPAIVSESVICHYRSNGPFHALGYSSSTSARVAQVMPK
eukprot:GHVU01206480.1.p1 GENE.GHVU01206480.1~~GHVU01206480.1.p1  ORF type:complete len:172 (-),score=8.17 GHVU01206480.1:585-1100(-)